MKIRLNAFLLPAYYGRITSRLLRGPSSGLVAFAPLQERNQPILGWSAWTSPKLTGRCKRTRIGRESCRTILCLSSRDVTQSPPGPGILSLRDDSSSSSSSSWDTDLQEFRDCWSATSRLANPDKDEFVDKILQSLRSPAPQGFHVLQRALLLGGDGRRAMAGTTNSTTIHYVLEQCQYLLKDGFHFCYRASDPSLSSSHQPGVDWSIVAPNEHVPSDWITIAVAKKRACVLSSGIQIATQILDLVVEASETQQPLDYDTMDELVSKLKHRIDLTLGTDLRGRTAADTAFTLCLAGVTDPALYDQLAYISQLEMQRLSQRSARSARDVLHVVEKLAAAGLQGPLVQSVYHLAAESYALRDDQFHTQRAALTRQPNENNNSNNNSNFNLLSIRPLLWLWRFSTRQSKVKTTTTTVIEQGNEQSPSPVTFQNNHLDPPEWLSKFANCSKPLILDMGCGSGVSLIGLASLENRMPNNLSSQSVLGPTGLDWNQYNYLGGDLSLLGVRLGQGIAKRWNLEGHLQYTLSSAQDLIDQVSQYYPGKVALIMIQFPSPYRLKESSGNAQLPSDMESGFMVNQTLMRSVAALARQSHGRLLLQSNCEDVAVTMRDLGKQVGLQCVPAEQPVWSVDDIDPKNNSGASRQRTAPQRTLEWLRLGGGSSTRAVGPEWSRVPWLPPGCATETEASCIIYGTPVHRCLMETDWPR